MVSSSSQVLDHQLIFYLMYGLGQFHHRQDKGEERRGEEKQSSCCFGLSQFHNRQNKKEQLLPNIEVGGEERRGEERRVGQLAATSIATGCCMSLHQHVTYHMTKHLGVSLEAVNKVCNRIVGHSLTKYVTE
jgi:hypothetical protein